MNVADLDKYRDQYDDLTFQEHQALYQRVVEEYPEQSFWSAPECARFLEFVQPQRVVEIGGWDGGLAEASYFLDRWVNLDWADVPQVCRKPGYQYVILQDFVWTWTEWGDAVVMSHVLEHMSEEHLRNLLSVMDARAIYVDAPLSEDHRIEWRGSLTAHVLDLSFREVDEVFREYGYARTFSAPSKANSFPSTVRWYER